MDKLVKEISTNTYKRITQAEFDASPELYKDRSSDVTYIYLKGLEAGFTNWQIKYMCRELVKLETNGFDDFRDVEKNYLAEMGLGNKTSVITHFVTTLGISVTDATGLMVKKVSESVALIAEDARVTIGSPIIMQIGIKYLTWVDPVSNELDSTQANNLTHAIQGFLTEYGRYGILGLEYGDEREGIMDYMESTNSYEGGGLKNYVFNPDIITAYGSEINARNAMIAELQEVFVKGNT